MCRRAVLVSRRLPLQLLPLVREPRRPLRSPQPGPPISMTRTGSSIRFNDFSNSLLFSKNELFVLFWKVSFSEERRRRLHKLQGKHKVWVSEASKFINMYGGNIAVDFDLEPATSPSGSSGRSY